MFQFKIYFKYKINYESFSDIKSNIYNFIQNLL